MTPVAKIPGLSYAVAIFPGRIICAVNNGDDTYPVIVEINGGRTWRLNPRFYVENSEKPLGLIHVRSSAVKLAHRLNVVRSAMPSPPLNGLASSS